MSEESETHAEVVKQMRVDFVIASRDGTVTMGGNALLEFADRAEAAHKREVDALQAQIEDLRKQIALVVVAETATTTKESLGVGNMTKMRKAVELALSLLDLGEDVPSMAVKQEDIDFMKAALAEPARQCDVGSAKDQSDRLHEFCHAQKFCDRCPLQKPAATDLTDCHLLWAQTPYESEAGTEKLPQAKRISGNGAGETKGGEGQ